jgi:hypothetical protein
LFQRHAQKQAVTDKLDRTVLPDSRTSAAAQAIGCQFVERGHFDRSAKEQIAVKARLK